MGLKQFRTNVYEDLFENSTVGRISSYSVRMRENTDHKNTEYGHFSKSGIYKVFQTFSISN